MSFPVVQPSHGALSLSARALNFIKKRSPLHKVCVVKKKGKFAKEKNYPSLSSYARAQKDRILWAYFSYLNNAESKTDLNIAAVIFNFANDHYIVNVIVQ